MGSNGEPQRELRSEPHGEPFSEQRREHQSPGDVWGTGGDGGLARGDTVGIDADCSPTRVCRNARDFTFDGIAEDEEDLATSWRHLLQREGKLSAGQPSIRELVLGPPDGSAE